MGRGKSKSASKQQSLRDYAGVLSAYAIVLTALFLVLFLLPYFGVQVLSMIGGPHVSIALV